MRRRVVLLQRLVEKAALAKISSPLRFHRLVVDSVGEIGRAEDASEALRVPSWATA